MAAEQVGSVLRNTRDFHRGIAQRFRQIAQQTSSARLQLLLSYMGEHEENLADSIDQTAAAMSEQKFRTWVRVPHESAELSKFLKQYKTAQPDSSFEDLLAIALQMDDLVAQFYDNLVSKADPDWLGETFQGLLQMEREEKKQLARQALRGLDI